MTAMDERSGEKGGKSVGLVITFIGLSVLSGRTEDWKQGGRRTRTDITTGEELNEI